MFMKVTFQSFMFCDIHRVICFSDSLTDFRLSDNLELFPLRSFDFENHAERTLQLTVLASDFVHTTTASVTVHVQDRNDVAPKFLNESYSSSVLENVNISYSVVQVRMYGDRNWLLSL